MPKLVISGGGETREVGLAPGATVGRLPENAIPIDAAEISRQHCRFTLERGSWFVEDLGSSNGTTVNGRKVTKFELQDGDEIAIGKWSFRFLDIDAPAASDDLEIEESGFGDDDEISLESRVFLILADGQVLDLPAGRISVGRNTKHAIRLKDASVSGDHAAIIREDEHVTIQDLGSSNGTFVNGRRIEEALVQSGDAVRFGQIEAVFGVGDPKDFLVPVESAGAEEEEADDWSDDRLDLSRVPSGSERLWNIFAIVAILCLGGAGYYLFTLEAAAGPLKPKPLVKGANLLPDGIWSFEPAAVAATEEEEDLGSRWVRARDAEGLEVALLEGGSASGRGHLELVTREDAKRPLVALAVDGSKPIGVSVAGGAPYDLSVQWAEATASPVLFIQWLASDPEGGLEKFELTREWLLAARDPGASWTTLSGQVTAPTGAVEARVGVGLLGEGMALFDDLRIQRAEEPSPNRTAEKNGFLLAVDGSGQLRLSRFQTLVVDGMGLAFAASESLPKALPQELQVAKAQSAAGYSGRSLQGGLALEVSVRATEDGFRATFSGEALRNAIGLRVPLGREAAGAPEAIVLRKDGEDEAAKLWRTAFAEERGHALILGPSTARARFSLPAGREGQVAFQTEGSAPMLTWSGMIDGSTLEIDIRVNFEAETEAARKLMDSAREAERAGRRGEAALLAGQVLSRYPFESATAAAAAELERGVLEAAQRELKSCQSQVEESRFYRTIRRQGELIQHLAQQEQTFAGLPVAADLAAVRAELSAELEALRAAEREEDAAVVLRRAKAYLKDDRVALARLFLSVLVQRYPGTAEATEAEALLADQKGGSKENG